MKQSNCSLTTVASWEQIIPLVRHTVVVSAGGGACGSASAARPINDAAMTFIVGSASSIGDRESSTTIPITAPVVRRKPSRRKTGAVDGRPSLDASPNREESLTLAHTGTTELPQPFRSARSGGSSVWLEIACMMLLIK